MGKPVQPQRPKQLLPEEITSQLMAVVRNQFYPDAAAGGENAKRWFADQHFIKRRVVLWPASWLNSRGVTLKPERYLEIVLNIFNEIKRHGATGAVRYWPGYLAKCVQDHFRFHGDEIYEEAKALRVQLEQAMRIAGSAVNRESDAVARLAEVQSVLAAKIRKQRCKPVADQMKLF